MCFDRKIIDNSFQDGRVIALYSEDGICEISGDEKTPDSKCDVEIVYK